MNLILLNKEDFWEGTGTARLTGRRYRHITGIHKARVGDELCVGVEDGSVGTGRVTEISAGAVLLNVTFTHLPPPPTEVTLLLALPRPIVLKRLLVAVASLGVKRIFLFNSSRVEKSYWKSRLLQENNLREQLVLGLEQAKDTVMPQVFFRKRFKPFVQDELAALVEGTTALLAHPEALTCFPSSVLGPVTLAVGPEGGFIPYEVEMFCDTGFSQVSLTPRVLKVETAVPALLSRFL